MPAARQYDLSIVGLNYKDERATAVDWRERLGEPYVVSDFDPEGEPGLGLGSTARSESEF